MPTGSHSEKLPGTLTPGIYCLILLHSCLFAWCLLNLCSQPLGFSHSCDWLQLLEYPNWLHCLTLRCAASVLVQSPHLTGHKPMTFHHCWRKAQTAGVGTRTVTARHLLGSPASLSSPSLSHAPTISPALSGFQMFSCTNSSQVSCVH